MKKTIVILILLILALAAGNLPVWGQAVNSGDLPLQMDYAVFRGQDRSANAYVEIYYNFPRSQLKFEPSEDGYVAVINFTLSLNDHSGKTIDTLTWKAGSKIDKLSKLNDKSYFISDMVADLIPVGEYMVVLDARNGDKIGHAAMPMSVPPFGDQLGISSIELAYNIEPDSAGKFVKAGHKIMPNPSRQFFRENKWVYIYSEGYGLDTSQTADSIYHVDMEILGNNGQVVKTFAGTTQPKPGESAVIMTGFAIDTLPPDNYTLKVTLADGDKSVSSTKEFSVLGSPEAGRRAVLSSVLAEFPEANNIASEEDARKFRDEITYIATFDELKLYDSLNLTGKSNFQKSFWAGRDPDPSTAENEFELEHYRRWKYAEAAYGRFQGEYAGWRTDRGRTYIMYGEPSEIERNASTIDSRGWERWWYHGIEGGVYFIFVDYENAADMTLVHSSKKNEVKDPNWESKIRMTDFQR